MHTELMRLQFVGLVEMYFILPECGPSAPLISGRDQGCGGVGKTNFKLHPSWDQATAIFNRPTAVSMTACVERYDQHIRHPRQECSRSICSMQYLS